MDKFLLGCVGLISVIAVTFSLIAYQRAIPAPTDLNSVSYDREENYGVAAGNDNSANCTTQGGVQICRYKIPLRASTTTPMVLRTPNATSTLALGSGCRLSTSSTTAKTVRFAKSVNQNATTTFLFGANVAANAPADIIATTSSDNFTFGPNQYFAMSMVGGSGVDSPAGVCSASFVVY